MKKQTDTEVKISSKTEKDALVLIEQFMPECSKTQRRIGQYLLDHAAAAVGMTAAKVANAVGASESTVVRYAMSLGFDGYPELLEALKEALRASLTSVQRIEMAQNSSGDPFLRSMRTDMENIKKTLADTNPKVFDTIAERLYGARRIYIVGARSSVALAEFLNFYLAQLFDEVRLVQMTSGNEIFDQLFSVNEEDVVIGISFPRYSKRTVDALDFSHKKGAYVCAVTDSFHSPLVKLADESVFAHNESDSFVDSMVAPMAVLNALIVSVVEKRPDECSRRLAQLEDIWAEYNVFNKARS